MISILSNTMTKLPPCPFSVCNGCNKNKIALSRNGNSINVRRCVSSFFSKSAKFIPCKKGLNDINEQFNIWNIQQQLNKFYNYT